MKQTCQLAIGLVALIAISAQTLDVQLQRAIQKEAASGDLQAAIQDYEKIVASAGSNHAVAAQALLHEAKAYQKLGDAKAGATYERILKQFPDQADAVAVARQDLNALAGPKPAAGFAKRTVCEECGDWNDVSFDGRWAVGTDWNTGDLEIRDVSTGKLARKLMIKAGDYKTSKDEADGAIFSKDARQIVYEWTPENDQSHDQLRLIVNEPGAKPRVVLDKSEYNGYWPVDWTKDGKRLLVMLSKSDRSTQLAWVSVPDGAIKPIKSLGLRHMGARTQPKLSRDEKFILYSALATDPGKWPPDQNYSRDVHVYVLSADGSTENELVKGSSTNDGPVWAPDGTHVLFVSNRLGSNFDLWSLPVNDGKAAGELQLVSEEVGRMSSIAVSQSTYFFYNARRGGQDVFVANIRQDGKATNPRRVTEYVGANVGPSWSPDGKFIAFKRQRPNENLWDLVVRSVETGEERKYLTGSPKYGRGGWFHDGKSMIVNAPAPQSGFGRLDLGSRATTLFVEGLLAMNALSPDDAVLYVGHGPGPANTPATMIGISGDIAALNPVTKEQKVVFEPKPGEGIYGFTPSPDGRTLAIVTGPAPCKPGQPNDSHLITVGVDGTGQRQLYDFQTAYPGWESTLTWSHDGYIYFGALGQTGAADYRVNHIARIPVAGGPVEQLGIEIRSTPPQMNHFIDLSPDGSQIVFATDEANISQVWAIDNVQTVLK